MALAASDDLRKVMNYGFTIVNNEPDGEYHDVCPEPGKRMESGHDDLGR